LTPLRSKGTIMACRQLWLAPAPGQVKARPSLRQVVGLLVMVAMRSPTPRRCSGAACARVFPDARLLPTAVGHLSRVVAPAPCVRCVFPDARLLPTRVGLPQKRRPSRHHAPCCTLPVARFPVLGCLCVSRLPSACVLTPLDQVQGRPCDAAAAQRRGVPVLLPPGRQRWSVLRWSTAWTSASASDVLRFHGC